MPATPALRRLRLRQENFKLEIFLGYTEFQASFGFVASPYLKSNKGNKRQC